MSLTSSCVTCMTQIDRRRQSRRVLVAYLSVILGVVARVPLLAIWAKIWTVLEGGEQNYFYFLDDIISNTKYYSLIKSSQFAFIIFQQCSLNKFIV